MELVNIVDQARTGDAAAFDRLVDAYRDMALGYARSLVRNEQEAEDAVQEAWVIAHRNLDGLLDSKAFVAWLRGIVRRRCLRHGDGRPAVPISNLEEASSGEDPERLIVDRLAHGSVRMAVAELSADQRQVVRLHYERGLSHREIGVELGLSLETVNMRLHAARQRLGRRLISMNESDSSMGRLGRVVGADGVLITIEFPPGASPPLVSRLDSGGESLCVIRRLPDGKCQAIPEAEGGIWNQGREVRNAGEPFTNALPNSIVARIMHATSEGGLFLPTGIKTIDLFAPLAQSGSVGIFAEWGVGTLVLVPELVRRLDVEANRLTIYAFVPPVRDEKQWHEVDAEMTPGSLRLEVFYIPVEDPISRSFVDGSGPLDAKLVLSRRLAEQGIWPSIDPLRSSSRAFSSERGRVADKVRELLRLYHSLQYSSDPEAERMLSQDEWLTVRRARLALRFLSQPFFVAEPYTGVLGADADISTATQTFEGILAGQYDDCRKEAFTMAGATPKEMD